jgi:HK97 family phage portal protein
MLAMDLAKATPEIYFEAKGSPKKVADAHPLHTLFHEPNAWQTWPDFAIMMQMGLVLRGNAFAVIIRNVAGDPLFFVPVNPDRVGLYEAADGSIFYMVNRSGLHEMAVLRDQPLMIPARDMLHLKGLSTNGLLGLSPISVAREAVGLALGQEQQAARWMGNAAKPAGILTTENKLTPDARERSREAWRAAQEGLVNSGKTAMLEGGLKWQPLSMTASDLEFIGSRRFQIEEIARMFRIPIPMIAEVQSAGRVDPDVLAQHYVNYTISEYAMIWAAALDKQFGLWRENLRVRFDMTVLLEADLASRVNTHRLAVLGALETPNEGRAGIGLDPSDDPQADKLLFPSNSTPYGSDHSGNAPDGAGRPEKGKGNADQPGADK